MIIVNHKVNTIEKLNATPPDYGIEIDVRAYNSRLILNHEPFVDGADFEEFLKHYKHKLIIINIKCEGIEKRVLEIVEKFKIKEYFLLDVTFPFMVKYINKGIHKFAVRFSEFESIQTCLNLAKKVEWVFVDNFSHLPTENKAFSLLKKHFKICIVSPDLFNRNDMNITDITKKIIKKYDIDAILTDDIEAW